jgi:fucose 4-O-acetylase-like acetyltransferase
LIINPTQRKTWIDVLKGIAIIFVAIAHHPWLPHKIFLIVSCFPIPLFFFISGYLFNPDVAFKDMLRRRFNTVLKPYFFTVFLISTTLILADKGPSIFWYLFWICYGNGSNLPKQALHLWFLPSLFLTTIFIWFLFKFIENLKKSIINQIFLFIFLIVCGVMMIRIFWDIRIPLFIVNLLSIDINNYLINGLIDNPAYSKANILKDNQFLLKGLPFSADLVFLTAAFFIAGYTVKQNNFENIFNKGLVATFMFFLFAALEYFYNYTINLNIRIYDNFIISTLLAISSIYVCVYSAFIIADKTKLLANTFQYVGRYSLIVFIFHPLIQSKSYYTIKSMLTDYGDYVAILPAFIAGVTVPLLLNWIVLERFKFFRFWYYAK